MKVVYVGDRSATGGAELSLLALFPHLDVDRRVILGEDGPMAQAYRDVAATEILPLVGMTQEMSLGGLVSTGDRARIAASVLRNALPLARRLRELSPDIVHTNSLYAGLYGSLAARLAGVPVVWHLRDRLAPDHLGPRGAGLMQQAVRRLPTHVIANSQTTASLVPDGVSVTVVPSPLPSSPTPSPRRGQGPTVFAVTSRLAPWKGQEQFLRAFALAFPNGAERAVILGAVQCGEDDYLQRLHVVAEELGITDRVDFRGHQPDVLEALADVDVLVHCPLIPEPFGRVIIEGLASGAAVLARGDGGSAELITHGVDGVFYDPTHAETLVQRLRQLARDPELRNRLGTAGRMTAAVYRPELIARRIESVYDKVLHGQASAG